MILLDAGRKVSTALLSLPGTDNVSALPRTLVLNSLLTASLQSQPRTRVRKNGVREAPGTVGVLWRWEKFLMRGPILCYNAAHTAT
jgi:hypothetical protein